jgi:hypothetical protein
MARQTATVEHEIELPSQLEPAQAVERRPRWELAECTCPDFCERDHEQD